MRAKNNLLITQKSMGVESSENVSTLKEQQKKQKESGTLGNVDCLRKFFFKFSKKSTKKFDAFFRIKAGEGDALKFKLVDGERGTV